MKKIAIVQARINSKRLPGKVLFKINELTLLEILYLRLLKAKLVDQIVFAIPKNKENNVLKNFLIKKNIPFFLGSENNVLDRYYQASKKHKADTVIRITADCPLIDPSIVDKVIAKHIHIKSSFTTNTHPPSFPDGLDVQVCSFKVLEYVWKNASTLYDKEHVFTHINNIKFIKINNFKSKFNYSSERWTVDEINDFKLIKYIVQYYHPNIYFSYNDILKLMKSNYKKFSINRQYTRNQGSIISVSEKIWNRAKKVIPGGNSFLSKNPETFLPNGWPTYYKKASGCKIWDINGKIYFDAIMSPGTNVLGYSNQEVNSAVIQTVKNSNMSTLNCPEEVELAEKLISLHPWSGMARFAKTGGEANAMAIRIARAASGRDKIAFCGYHGWHDWYLSANIKDNNNLNNYLLEGLDTKGVPKKLKGTLYGFKYNDIEGLEEIIKKDKEIGVVKMEVIRNFLPKKNFLKKVRNICNKNNLILIFDECTTGFRLNDGGIHKHFNVNPDIAVFGKALGNGYPITAILGKEKVMKFATRSFISSTYWTDKIGYVAALETLKFMENKKTWNIIKKNGVDIKKNWSKLAKKNNLDIVISGTDSIPSFSFKKDKNNMYKIFITQEMLKKKILASNYIFISILHTKGELNKYYKELDLVFKKLFLYENNKYKINYKDLELKRNFFKRLN